MTNEDLALRALKAIVRGFDRDTLDAPTARSLFAAYEAIWAKLGPATDLTVECLHLADDGAYDAIHPAWRSSADGHKHFLYLAEVVIEEWAVLGDVPSRA